MTLTFLEEDTPFPDPALACNDSKGLLAIGFNLTVERLEEAYRLGIFPWFNELDPVMWWSPDPRAVLFPSDYKPNKRFLRLITNTHWRVTHNHAFKLVIQQCAERKEGTWITPEIIENYILLHEKGLARSIEVWDEEELIGGLYGILQGGVFCGESMFSRVSNASKVAFYHLITSFTEAGGELIDCQILNPHTESLGAIEIPRSEYLIYLKQLQSKNVQY